ncbi:CAP domain-containing protein [Caldibacillus lycopersici]|uniref:CAP domain-containing protein n=1 Tax=Perspicuibacillus lycopersici TaxID=1325689 RepID=A0AAE3IPF5_9BACI|nr:CAP domain-containing protein [Perspicuibacillus lycopersici]MCU9612022.1 CAP domain-containing protein [Perspicuibacillus lycopersici]
MGKKLVTSFATTMLLLGLTACNGNDNDSALPTSYNNNNQNNGLDTVSNRMNTRSYLNNFRTQDGSYYPSRVINNTDNTTGRNTGNEDDNQINQNDRNKLEDISATNTDTSSNKYPHTRAVLIQDAKYKYVNINENANTNQNNDWGNTIKQKITERFNQFKQGGNQQQANQNTQNTEQQQTETTQKQQTAQNNQQQANQTQQQQQAAQQQTEQAKKQNETTENAQGSTSQYVQQVIDLTNQERKNAGLAALKADSELNAVALKKSQDMQQNNYFSHTSPTYGSPFDMMRDFGVDYQSAGENIAQGQRTPQEVVDAWMNSPGHRANILNAKFTHIGVGFEASGNHWTQMFVGR